MITQFKYVIFSYGLFLGWLLSFPYNGPVLSRLVSEHGTAIASFSLTYTVAPVVFLLIYPFLKIKEEHSKTMMIWSIHISLLGTLIIFITDPLFWYPTFTVMGIASVLFIIGWSYFYTMEIPIAKKIPVMALVIITGNLIYYVINLLNNVVPANILLLFMLTLLGGSLWTANKNGYKKQISIELEKEPFPIKLVFIFSIFLFAINLNGGLTFHSINPSFDQLFVVFFKYYSIVPYVAILILMYFYGTKLPMMFPVFLGITLLGLAYIFYGLIDENWYSYFIIETFMQAGWALLDLFLWTLFGLIASIYGRPLKISGYALLANLFAVFAGGVLSLRILNHLENPFLISSAIAIGIIFISLLIVPWINLTIERDLRNKLIKSTIQSTHPQESPSLSFNLPQYELLTPREKEVSDLLLHGYTNKQIAEMLHISENTLKTHSRNIYSKLNVANKRELLQLSFSSAHSMRPDKK